MKKQCRSCRKKTECREIEIEGYSEAYYCKRCYPKIIQLIKFIRENEGCSEEEAKKIFANLQIMIKYAPLELARRLGYRSLRQIGDQKE